MPRVLQVAKVNVVWGRRVGEADEVRSHTGHTRSWNRKKKKRSLQGDVSPSFISSFISAFFLSKCSRDLFHGRNHAKIQ